MSEHVEQIIDSIITNLKKGKDLTDTFNHMFIGSYQISGRSFNEWSRELRIKIPEEIFPGTVAGIAAKIAINFQTITFYLTSTQAQLKILTAGKSTIYNKKFKSLSKEYTKESGNLPAFNTLDVLAESDTVDINMAIQRLTIEENFWKKNLENLMQVRRLLETITRAQYTDLVLQQDIRNKKVITKPNNINDINGTETYDNGE